MKGDQEKKQESTSVGYTINNQILVCVTISKQPKRRIRRKLPLEMRNNVSRQFTVKDSNLRAFASSNWKRCTIWLARYRYKVQGAHRCRNGRALCCKHPSFGLESWSCLSLCGICFPCQMLNNSTLVCPVWCFNVTQEGIPNSQITTPGTYI